MARRKHGRPINSKYSIPPKKKNDWEDFTANNTKILKEQIASKEQMVYENTRNLDNIQTLHDE